MGLTEYAIRLNTIEDAHAVIKVINDHNTCNNYDKVGEFVDITGYLNFRNTCYMVAINGGGREMTSNWFYAHFPRSVVWMSIVPDRYGFLNKPQGWRECEDYIWESQSFGNISINTLPQEVIDYISNKTDNVKVAPHMQRTKLDKDDRKRIISTKN